MHQNPLEPAFLAFRQTSFHRFCQSEVIRACSVEDAVDFGRGTFCEIELREIALVGQNGDTLSKFLEPLKR